MKKTLRLLKQIIFFPLNFSRSRLATSSIEIDGIQQESGDIVEEEGKKIAVYKTKDGAILKFNPTCTHLKCLVGWDGAKKHWVCPCHGAEYTAEGKVVSGPAKKDLTRL